MSTNDQSLILHQPLPVEAFTHSRALPNKRQAQVPHSSVSGHKFVLTHPAPALLAVLDRIATSLERLSERGGQRAGGHPDETSEARGTHPSENPRPLIPPVAVPTDARKQDFSSDRLAHLEASVAEIRHLLKAQAGQVVKRLYAVTEVAELTGYKPWTIRQACNKGRIKGNKGDDGRWRVPHEEVLRLQDEGLPAE